MTYDSTAVNGWAPPEGRTAMAFYDGSVALKSGTIAVQSESWETERMSEGLKLIVISNGRLRCKIPDCPQTTISSPTVCAVWNLGENEGMQAFEPGTPIRYTAIELSPQSLGVHLAEDAQSMQERLRLKDNGRPHLMTVAATRPVQALCAQIAACPLKEGAPRTLYLTAKALEITALVLDTLDPSPAVAALPRLPPGDIERIRAAHDLLVSRLQSPPSLSELSLAVGINVKKLKTGFRHLYGDSVFAYLQQLRLGVAYRLLTEEDMSVSAAAYKVGYSPAHFSVAFRKKYGSSPKEVRG
ncbi:pyochelin biosynthesis transcriptional regulator PchR [Novispirillum itersonii subsp. nipponicum]